jgi:hypothetical protein
MTEENPAPGPWSPQNKLSPLERIIAAAHNAKEKERRATEETEALLKNGRLVKTEPDPLTHYLQKSVIDIDSKLATYFNMHGVAIDDELPEDFSPTDDNEKNNANAFWLTKISFPFSRHIFHYYNRTSKKWKPLETEWDLRHIFNTIQKFGNKTAAAQFREDDFLLKVLNASVFKKRYHDTLEDMLDPKA